jgi:hypothetical protein
MATHTRRWWFWGLALAVLLAGVSWLGRRQLDGWTRAKLIRRDQSQIATLGERQAVLLVWRLASAEPPGVEAVAQAWTDPRPAVAGMAVSATQGLLQRWSHLPAEQAAPRVALLARCLAQHAPQMPPAQRDAAVALAERLVSWPTAGAPTDTAQFIADCDVLLRLPPSGPEELRVATAPPPPQPTAVAPPSPQLPEIVPPVAAPPAAALKPVPLPLADANRERPEEPRRLPSPKAIRLSDE